MIQDNEQLWVKQLGNGRTLLLIHGLLMNGDMFEPVLESLMKNYHVLVPDLRGFGRSGQLAPPYTVEQHAQDLEKLLKSLSISSIVVLGYSQGGVVAQQLALDYPNLVSHLVLCCTFSYNQLTWQEKIEGLVMPWLIRLFNTKQLVQLFKGLTLEQSKQLEKIIASNHKPRMVEATEIMLKFDSRHRLRDIHCPTLIIAGENDTAVPLHHARMLSKGIPNAKLLVIPSAGHEMIWTNGTDIINAVESFLGEA
jgi:pimeloyl-ACP methyl ester carboxylesterase